MDERHPAASAERAILTQLLVAAHRGDERARQRLIDHATTAAAAALALDVLIGFELTKAQRSGGLPELAAGEKRLVAAIVREIGGRP